LAVLATLLLTALDIRFASTGNALSQAEAAIGITQPEWRLQSETTMAGQKPGHDRGIKRVSPSGRRRAGRSD
jgi:hypothetical protein